MANEWNITKEELMEDTAEVFAGEGKGVNDENKIVPIVNKGNPAESGTAAYAAEPAAQAAASIIAAQADQISAQPTVPDVQTTVQPASPNASVTAEPAAQNVQAAAQADIYRSVEAASAEAGDSSANLDAQPAPDTSDTGARTEPGRRHRRKTSSYTEDYDDDLDEDEEDRPRKRFFRFRSGNDEESRDKMILSRIKDEDLMKYLELEQRRLEFLQQAKEAKEKRILTAFQLLISLAAIVAITYLLQDNPTILISILYIVGIVAALNVWKNPHDKGRKR